MGNSPSLKNQQKEDMNHFFTAVSPQTPADEKEDASKKKQHGMIKKRNKEKPAIATLSILNNFCLMYFRCARI